ncbi:MAG TPA: adenine phosphoribosyltransferase [Gemmatimonadaceae bacterium]|nr:adenine phosphoribosyltransferase [Gemmatimonadaceae bacterium]
MDALEALVRKAIRDVPDFPKPGIVFKDITPLLADAELFRRVTEAMARPFAGAGITHVVAIESRGFLLGAPVAQALNAGLLPVRKPGKLPAKTASVEYALEYGTDTLEIHADACDHAARVLVVDDVLATGGTAKATADLVRGRGAEVAGFSFLMILSFLGGASRLGGVPARSVVQY